MSTKKLHLAFLFFFAIFNQLFPYTQIIYNDSYRAHASLMKTQKKDSFYLAKLSFDANIKISKDELFYLTSFQEDRFVKLKQIERGIKNLARKNRFQSITVSLSDSGSYGQHLHLSLNAQWMIKKIDFKGILFDKLHYQNLYKQQEGDLFDVSLHEQSLQAMKEHLHNQGLFESKIFDEIFYHKKEKSVNIVIRFSFGPRYSVRRVTCQAKEGTTTPPAALANTIRSQLKHSLVGANYQKDAIKKISRKIKLDLQAKGFRHPRITLAHTLNPLSKSVNLMFILTTGKKTQFLCTGNKLFSKKQILDDIIGSDQPSWLLSPEIISEHILHEYYKKGYWNTSVTHEASSDGTCIFTINESPPARFDSIVLFDVHEQKKIDPAPFFNRLSDKKIIDEELVQACLEDLKHYYLSHGFWDIAIIDKQYLENKTSSLFAVKVSFDKGKQYLSTGFCIEQFPELENHLFFKKYTLNQSSNYIPFNAQWLQEQKVFLLSYFQQQGYWYVTVYPELESTQDSHANCINVFVRWIINTGPQVTFGPLIIRGNTALPFSTIAHNITFKRGDLWDKQQIELTRKKLRNLGIFKQVTIQPADLEKRKSEKPIMVTLIDDDPIEVRMRLGYFLTSKNFLFKRQSTPKLGSSLSIKNITNRADKLLLSVDLTKFERSVVIDYQQPCLLGHSATGNIKGYINKYIHPVDIGSSGSAYEAEQNGFLLGISKEYKENYYWGVTIGNEWMKTSRVRGNLNFNPRLIDKTVPYFFVEPSWIINTLDDRLNTTRGIYTFCSLKIMIPESLGDVSARLMAEQAFFYPINSSLVVAAHFRVGHIFRKAFENVMPIERFYLGGPYSLRGYEKDAVPPLGISYRHDDHGDVKKEFTIQGGSSMINGNIELRACLYNNFWTVLFSDIGVLDQSGFMGSGTWYPTSGFGFRYKTPIGSLRFDIGWKWKQSFEKDSSYAWYLTLGEAF